jgi:hypothetical protein
MSVEGQGLVFAASNSSSCHRTELYLKKQIFFGECGVGASCPTFSLIEETWHRAKAEVYRGSTWLSRLDKLLQKRKRMATPLGHSKHESARYIGVV